MKMSLTKSRRFSTDIDLRKTLQEIQQRPRVNSELTQHTNLMSNADDEEHKQHVRMHSGDTSISSGLSVDASNSPCDFPVLTSDQKCDVHNLLVHSYHK